jgi:hypothetical protein
MKRTLLSAVAATLVLGMAAIPVCACGGAALPAIGKADVKNLTVEADAAVAISAPIDIGSAAASAED